MSIADGWIYHLTPLDGVAADRWIEGVFGRTHTHEFTVRWIDDQGNETLGDPLDVRDQQGSRGGELMGHGRPEDQPLPVKNDKPYVQDLMLEDVAQAELDPYTMELRPSFAALKLSIEARRELGHKRYGVPGLQPDNGRDMLRDAFEEVLDACVYTRALTEETGSEEDADCYANLLAEATYLQGRILEREGHASTTAPTEPEPAPVNEP